MTENIFIDIEKNLNLLDFQRNLDTKKVKAGKFFWHFSFIYFCSNQKFEPYILTNNYVDIFYRPAEIRANILENFKGKPTEQIEEWDFESILGRYRSRVFSSIEILLTEMKDFIVNNPQDFEHVDPGKAEFLELDLIDNKQPYLVTPSKAFKSILDAANYRYLDNVVFSEIEYIKPGLVHQLNSIMDELVKTEAFFHSVDYLQSFLNTGHQKIYYQILTNGPTDALEKAIEIEPEISRLTAAQISYIVRLKYVDQKGNPLNEGALKKAITRYQAINGK